MAKGFVPGARCATVFCTPNDSIEVSSIVVLLPVPESRWRLVDPAGPGHEVLDRTGCKQLARRIQHVDTEVFRSSDHAALVQRLHGLAITAAPDIGVAGDAANGLLALGAAAAQQQVGDALLGDDVADVVTIDHDRR